MAAEYEPLVDVRKNFKIDWYRVPIATDRLKKLTKRSDTLGWLQSVGWLAIVAATAYACYYTFYNGIWWGFAVSLFIHGTIYTFNPGLVTHELSHGTVFKTKWLNGFFLRLYSLLGWVNFHHYKRSHTFHHIYTLHPRGDREVVLPGYPSLSPLRLFWMFTFNVPGFWLVLKNTFKLAVLGKHDREWTDAIFPEDDPKGRWVLRRWAIAILSFHVGVIAVAAVTGIWLLPVLVTLSNWVANWWKYFIGVTMHTGLRDNVADFRKCCRSIKLDPFSRFIYWNMNYHTEHHMFAAVPCYRLRTLSKEVAWDMPAPRSLIGAWKEMRMVWKKQQEDPQYQYDTPVPDHSSEETGQDDLAASIGDLAPKELK